MRTGQITKRIVASLLAITALTVFAQSTPGAAQWTPLQSLSGDNAIGSPGGTHPLVASGDAVHAVWWQGGSIWYRRRDLRPGI